MSKFVIVLAVAAFAQILNAEETPVAKAVAQTQSETVPSAQIRSFGLFNNFPAFEPFQFPQIDPEAIKNLKPDGPNSDVQGQYSSQSQSTKIVDGKVVSTSSQTKINNDNGTVTEESSGN